MSYRLYRASEVGYMLHINLSIFLKTFDMSDNWKCHRLNNRRRGNDETAIIEQWICAVNTCTVNFSEIVRSEAM